MVYIKDNPINNFINYFFSLNPYELTLIGNILGIIIAKPLTLNQQNTLGNFLELIGQQILTIQAQGSNLAPNFNLLPSTLVKIPSLVTSTLSI